MNRTRLALSLGLLAASLSSPVHALHKCEADGRISYQDTPCPQAAGTGADELQRRQRLDLLHRRLDQLQAQGVGLSTGTAGGGASSTGRTGPSEARPPSDASQLAQLHNAEVAAIVNSKSPAQQARPFHRMSDAELDQERERKIKALNEASVRHNQRTFDRLQSDVEAMRQACGGRVPDLPHVGMADDYFRRCTALARFSATSQIVVAEDHGVPLRLYVYPSGKVRRVYSVDGTVTAVQP